MDPTDRLPEERVGTTERILGRSVELEAVAAACDREARDHEEAAARLRARAANLREKSMEYQHAARAIESAEMVDGVLRPKGSR